MQPFSLKICRWIFFKAKSKKIAPKQFKNQPIGRFIGFELPLKYFNFKQVVPFDSPSVKCEELNIFVGNSSTIENNHLDVLAGLKRVSDYNFNLGITLAYGDKDKYLNKVKKEFKKTFKE